jgi:hypothetical protein
VPRLVDVLPNGPHHYATVQVFLAGGVPEVMLHLRDAGLLKLHARTVTGRTLGENLAWWETSERRRRLRAKLQALDGIDPDDVIMHPRGPARAASRSTITFLRAISRRRGAGEEHGHRPGTDRRRRRVPARGAGARLHVGGRRDHRRQGGKRARRATCWC